MTIDPHHVIAFIANNAERLPCLLRHLQQVPWLGPADGIEQFGVGRYAPDHSFLLRDKPGRLVAPLSVFDLLAGDLETRLLMAHASSATPAVEDSQPYRVGGWLLALQGIVALDPESRATLLETLPEFQREARRGPQDAELVFLQLIAALARDGLLAASGADEELVHRFRQAALAANVPVNILASNGRDLVACRLGPPLFYCLLEGVARCEPCRVGDGYPWVGHQHTSHRELKAVCVSNRPVGFAESWLEIPLGQVLVVNPTLELQIIA